MMMSHHYHPRRMLPPGNNRKRKLHEADKPAALKAPEPPTSNRLLAGYLAHEFLTKGTLFGQKYDPNSARSEFDGSSQPKLQAAESGTERSRQVVGKEHQSYGEVASIMKTDGTHIKGIVNPTQLSRWIHM